MKRMDKQEIANKINFLATNRILDLKIQQEQEKIRVKLGGIPDGDLNNAIYEARELNKDIVTSLFLTQPGPMLTPAFN